MKLWRLFGILQVTLADIWPTRPADESTPIGIRLGIGSETSMNVGWSSYAQPQGKVCISYGTEPGILNQKACSHNVNTYGTSRVWFSQVELTELEPAQQYYYEIEAHNTTVNSFTMTRAPGDQTPYSFATLADLGFHSYFGITDFDTHPTVQQWNNMKDQFDFTFFPGDYAYADDALLNFKDAIAELTGQDAYQSLLERFYDLVSPITSSQPFMLTAGNHESACIEIPILDDLCPYGQQNFTDIRTRYNSMFPYGFDSKSDNADAISNRTVANQLAYPPLWYSFESGLVHFVFIDTETDFKNAPEESSKFGGMDEGPFGFDGQQLEWLKADLASVDRSITPWVIVGGHRPWYTTAQLRKCQSCQDTFEDIFFEYGVDLVITGHVHHSERFSPVYQNSADSNGYDNPNAPMYIVIGGAGNSEGLVPIDYLTMPDGFEWGDGISLAFAIVDILSPTDLRVRFIRSFDGNELDSSTLHKQHSDRFVRQTIPSTDNGIDWGFLL